MFGLNRIGRSIPALLALVASTLLATGPALAQEAHDQGAERLVIADATSNTLRVLDGADLKGLGSFSMPGPIGTVAASADGRWVYAVHTAVNRVTVLDTGLRLEDHGDHKDLQQGAPFVRGTILPGRRPIDFWVGQGRATVHNDDDGTLAVFDDGRLELALDYTEIKGEGTGHNNAVVLGDTVLLSYASAGRVTAYGLDGSVKNRFEGCQGTHGWTTRTTTQAAAGCTDGVMVFNTQADGSVRMTKIGEPAGSPETSRVSMMASHPDNATMVGNFGQGLALISPDQPTLKSAPLAANPVKLGFDHDGKRLAVLTFDGHIQSIDPTTGQLLWRIAAVAPVNTTTGAPRPSIAVGEDTVWVTEPTKGELLGISLADGTITHRVVLGGAPTNLALVSVEGVKH